MSCAVPSCKNYKSRRPPGVSFFRFPKDDNMLNMWLKILNLGTGWTLSPNKFVCSKHFAANAFTVHRGERGRRPLKRSAVPSLFLEQTEKCLDRGFAIPSSPGPSCSAFSCSAAKQEKPAKSKKKLRKRTRILSESNKVPIPKNKKKYKWLAAIDRPLDTFVVHERVCSAHFPVTDFERNATRKTLKPGTVPTLNLPVSSYSYTHEGSDSDNDSHYSSDSNKGFREEKENMLASSGSDKEHTANAGETTDHFLLGPRRTKENPSNVSSPRFPKGECRFRLWLSLLGINNENITWKKNMFVCSDHFGSNDFLPDSQFRMLKDSAVPYISTSEKRDGNLDDDLKFLTLKEENFAEDEHSYFKTEVDTTETNEQSKSLCWICAKCLQTEEDCIYFNYQIEGREDTIKDCFITCVPQLEGHIVDSDSICHDCLNEMVAALNFIEKCLNIQKGQQKLGKQLSPMPKMEDLSFNVDNMINDNDNNNCDDDIFGDDVDVENIKSYFFIGLKQKNLGSCFPTVQSQLIKSGVDLIKADVNSKKQKKIFFVCSNNVEENMIKDRKRNVTYACLQCAVTFQNQVLYLQHCSEVHNNRPPTKKSSQIAKSAGPTFVELEDLRRLALPETTAVVTATGIQGTFPDLQIDLTNVGVKSVRMLGSGNSQKKRIVFLGTWRTDESLVGKRGIFRCMLCPEMFVYEKDYYTHYKEGHLCECTSCSMTFVNPTALTTHRKLAHPLEQVYECNKCRRKFIRHPSYLAHKESFKDSPTCSVKCVECKAIFYSMSKYRQHVAEKSCKTRKNYKLNEVLCDQCGKQFACPQRLKSHKKFVHEARYECMCQKCGKICKGLQNLRSHMLTHDPNRVKTVFMCDKCPKRFTKKPGLLAHQAKFHENKILYRCDPCNKSFVTDSGLKTHNRHFHDTNHPYTCHICSEVFARSDYLNRHIRAHDRLGDQENLIATGRRQEQIKFAKRHRPTGKKYLSQAPCLCKICNKIYSSATIKAHYRSHVKFRLHRCAYCPNSFTSYPNCKRHEKRHEDPSFGLQCDICFNKFRKESDLEIHMQKHQSKLRYTCNLCGKKFGRVYMLENHKVNEHPDLMKKREEIYNELIKEIVHVIEPSEEDDYSPSIPYRGYKVTMEESIELQQALDQLQEET